MAKNRISRKELLKKPDEFITFSGKLIQFGIAHKAQIAIGCAVFLLVVVIFSVAQFLGDRAENQAYVKLGEILKKYEEKQQDTPLGEAYQAVKGDFEDFLASYGGKDGGRIGRLVFANISLNGQDTDLAIDLYRDSLTEFTAHSYFQNLVFSGLGYAYEAKKDLAKAIEFFEKIVASTNSLMKDEALFSLGRLYREAGDMEKSRSAYQQIVSEYTDSVYLEIAKDKVAG